MLNLYTLHPRRPGLFGTKMIVEKLSVITDSPIYRIVAAQFIATLLAAASCLAFNRVAVISALMAGMVCIIPGLYMLVVSLRPVTQTSTGLAQAVRGAAGKFALTVSMFALVFVFVRPLNAVAFFATFVLLQMCVALVPFIDSRRSENKRLLP